MTLAAMQFRVCHQKHKYYNIQNHNPVLFCMGVKLCHVTGMIQNDDV
jgi:hypothetical protein